MVKEENLEVLSWLSPCAEKKAKRGRKGKVTVEEAAAEGVNGWSNKLIDNEKNDRRVSKRQLRSREVTAEGFERGAPVDASKRDNLKRTGQSRKSVMLQEKATAEGPECDELPNLVAPKTLHQNKNTKRGRRMTLQVQPQEVEVDNEVIVEESVEGTSQEDDVSKKTDLKKGGLRKRSQNVEKDCVAEERFIIRRSARKAAKTAVEITVVEPALGDDIYLPDKREEECLASGQTKYAAEKADKLDEATQFSSSSPVQAKESTEEDSVNREGNVQSLTNCGTATPFLLNDSVGGNTNNPRDKNASEPSCVTEDASDTFCCVGVETATPARCEEPPSSIAGELDRDIRSSKTSESSDSLEVNHGNSGRLGKEKNGPVELLGLSRNIQSTVVENEDSHCFIDMVANDEDTVAQLENKGNERSCLRTEKPDHTSSMDNFVAGLSIGRCLTESRRPELHDASETICRIMVETASKARCKKPPSSVVGELEGDMGTGETSENRYALEVDHGINEQIGIEGNGPEELLDSSKNSQTRVGNNLPAADHQDNQSFIDMVSDDQGKDADLENQRREGSWCSTQKRDHNLFVDNFEAGVSISGRCLTESRNPELPDQHHSFIVLQNFDQLSTEVCKDSDKNVEISPEKAEQISQSASENYHSTPWAWNNDDGVVGICSEKVTASFSPSLFEVPLNTTFSSSFTLENCGVAGDPVCCSSAKPTMLESSEVTDTNEEQPSSSLSELVERTRDRGTNENNMQCTGEDGFKKELCLSEKENTMGSRHQVSSSDAPLTEQVYFTELRVYESSCKGAELSVSPGYLRNLFGAVETEEENCKKTSQENLFRLVNGSEQKIWAINEKPTLKLQEQSNNSIKKQSLHIVCEDDVVTSSERSNSTAANNVSRSTKLNIEEEHNSENLATPFFPSCSKRSDMQHDILYREDYTEASSVKDASESPEVKVQLVPDVCGSILSSTRLVDDVMAKKVQDISFELLTVDDNTYLSENASVPLKLIGGTLNRPSSSSTPKQFEMSNEQSDQAYKFTESDLHQVNFDDLFLSEESNNPKCKMEDYGGELQIAGSCSIPAAQSDVDTSLNRDVMEVMADTEHQGIEHIHEDHDQMDVQLVTEGDKDGPTEKADVITTACVVTKEMGSSSPAGRSSSVSSEPDTEHQESFHAFEDPMKMEATPVSLSSSLQLDVLCNTLHSDYYSEPKACSASRTLANNDCSFSSAMKHSEHVHKFEDLAFKLLPAGENDTPVENFSTQLTSNKGTQKVSSFCSIAELSTAGASEPVHCSTVECALTESSEAFYSNLEQVSSFLIDCEHGTGERQSFRSNKGLVKSIHTDDATGNTMHQTPVLTNDNLHAELSKQAESFRSGDRCDSICTEAEKPETSVGQGSSDFLPKEEMVADYKVMKANVQSPGVEEGLTVPRPSPATFQKRLKEAGEKDTHLGSKKSMSESPLCVTTSLLYSQPPVDGTPRVISGFMKGESSCTSKGGVRSFQNYIEVNLHSNDKSAMKQVEQAKNSTQTSIQCLGFKDGLVKVEEEFKDKSVSRMTKDNVFSLVRGERHSGSLKDTNFSCDADMNSFLELMEKDIDDYLQTVNSSPSIPQDKTNYMLDNRNDNHTPQDFDYSHSSQDVRGNIVSSAAKELFVWQSASKMCLTPEVPTGSMDDSHTILHPNEFSSAKTVQRNFVVHSADTDEPLVKRECHSFGGNVEEVANTIKALEEVSEAKCMPSIDHYVDAKGDSINSKESEHGVSFTGDVVTHYGSTDLCPNHSEGRSESMLDAECDRGVGGQCIPEEQKSCQEKTAAQTDHIQKEEKEDIAIFDNPTCTEPDDQQSLPNEVSESRDVDSNALLGELAISDVVETDQDRRVGWQIGNEEKVDDPINVIQQGICDTADCLAPTQAEVLGSLLCDIGKDVELDRDHIQISKKFHGNQGTLDTYAENLKAFDAVGNLDDTQVTKRRNRTIMIHGTPRKPLFQSHMQKENMVTPKRPQMVNATAIKTAMKRKVLKEIWK